MFVNDIAIINKTLQNKIVKEINSTGQGIEIIFTDGTVFKINTMYYNMEIV